MAPTAAPAARKPAAANPPAPAPDGNPLRARFAAARTELAAGLIEREGEIDLILTALLAGEHALLVGPPGTAKSLTVDALLAWTGARGFSILMTKTTNPEDVCGPLDIQEFVDNKTWSRVTAGWLPEAEVCFLDEIWKSSGAILNTLLKMLNEGLFQNNGVWNKIPLRLCVAASNEWPSPETGQELSALLDRFVLRKTVRPIATARGEERLYDFDGVRRAPAVARPVTIAEVDAARAEAAATPWGEPAREAFREIVKRLAAEGICPGDRRRYKAVGVARAYAYLCGADEVRPEHLEILEHVLWDDPREQPAKAAAVVMAVANPAAARVNAMLAEAEDVVRGVDLRDLASCQSADAKLNEIARRLAEISTVKAVSARQHVQDEVRRLRVATVNHLGG